MRRLKKGKITTPLYVNKTRNMETEIHRSRSIPKASVVLEVVFFVGAIQSFTFGSSFKLFAFELDCLCMLGITFI